MAATVPAVEFKQVSKRFGTVQAVAEVSLSIRAGEFFSLLGPSGCGKTTLLRLIAGLETPDSGRLAIHGTDTAVIPAHERSVNTVFQSYALFPHLNVYDNVAFGLRMKRVPKSAIAERVARVVDMVQIGELQDRKPAQLSGGQKQRVALARAIVNEPQVLLLDEPLGALDLKLRKQLQEELLALQRRLGITFVYVTHDQEEALVLSDRIAVMNAGRIVQFGDVEALYERPRTRFVSQFLGSASLLPATVTARDGTGAAVDTPIGPLRVEFGSQPSPASQRPAFTLAIRPEKIALRETSAAAEPNCVRVRVREVIYIGSETHYVLAAGGQIFRAEMMNSRIGPQGFDRGQEALACLPPAGLMVLED